ncbi:DUF1961 family protein [Nonomuraea ferruginea]
MRLEICRPTGRPPAWCSGAWPACGWTVRVGDRERSLRSCNLRESHGFHLVAQGVDPWSAVLDALGVQAAG